MTALDAFVLLNLRECTGQIDAVVTHLNLDAPAGWFGRRWTCDPSAVAQFCTKNKFILCMSLPIVQQASPSKASRVFISSAMMCWILCQLRLKG